MARFTADFIVTRPDADRFIAFVAQDFFQKEGFQYVSFKGENVWRKGMGALAAPRFMKLEFKDGRVHLEAWLRTVWLPGVYGKEMDLTGAWGFAVKELFRGTVQQLIGLLQQPQMVNGTQQPPHMQPQMSCGEQAAPSCGKIQAAGPEPQQPVPVIVHSTQGSAVLALVMGLVGLLGLLIPIAGIVCGVIAILSGMKGRCSPAGGMATAGFILGIIAIVLSAASWALTVFVAFMRL